MCKKCNIGFGSQNFHFLENTVRVCPNRHTECKQWTECGQVSPHRLYRSLFRDSIEWSAKRFRIIRWGKGLTGTPFARWTTNENTQYKHSRFKKNISREKNLSQWNVECPTQSIAVGPCWVRTGRLSLIWEKELRRSAKLTKCETWVRSLSKTYHNMNWGSLSFVFILLGVGL